jgi:peptide/nickel transport system permease protein
MIWGIVLRRILVGVATLIFVSLVVFLGTQVLPGDAAQIRLGQEATPENVAILRTRLGLDRPMHEQYLGWLQGIFQGDLGRSLAADVPVSRMIADRWFNTVIVAAWTAAISVPISIILGLVAAMWPGSAYDRGLTLVNVALMATPEFFVATCLVAVFVLSMGVGSAIVIGSTDGMGSFELLRHFIYPVITLSFITSSQMIRLTRAALLNVMTAPYIEMARLKGVPRHRLVLRHALPNAIGPIVNVVALNLAYLISGVVVVEVYFGYSGLAVLLVQAVQTRDFFVIQSLAMLFCAVYVAIILIADLAALLSNPRLRHPK